MHFLPCLITNTVNKSNNHLIALPPFHQVSLNLEPLTEAYDNSTNKDETVKGLQVATPTASSQLRSHLVHFGSRDQHVQEDKGSSLENQMPKANIPQKHQTAPNSSNQEIGGQTTSDLLSGWLTARQMPVTVNVSVLFADIPSYTCSYSGAWKQTEKCSGGLRLERRHVNSSSEREPFASPKG